MGRQAHNNYMLREFLLALRKVDHFHLDSRYFPIATKDFLPHSAIHEFGALPLGMKGDKILNIGLLEPRRLFIRTNISRLVRAKGYTPSFYQIDRSEFEVIVKEHYPTSGQQSAPK